MIEKTMQSVKFQTCAFGLSSGILWGVTLFLMAIIAGCCDNWGIAFMNVMSGIYIGYSAGFVGAVIGLLWGFVDGLISGLIFAWLYNFCASITYCKCSKCNCIDCKCKKGK